MNVHEQMSQMALLYTLRGEHLSQIILKSMRKSKIGLDKLNKFMTILSFDLHV